MMLDKDAPLPQVHLALRALHSYWCSALLAQPVDVMDKVAAAVGGMDFPEFGRALVEGQVLRLNTGLVAGLDELGLRVEVLGSDGSSWYGLVCVAGSRLGLRPEYVQQLLPRDVDAALRGLLDDAPDEGGVGDGC